MQLSLSAVVALLLISFVDAENASVAAATEAPTVREYFYVGGGYVDDGTGSGGQIFSRQMYVEKLTPWTGVTKPYPLVFIHGQAQTGTNWLNKPDGQRGWASYFVSEGYEVYLIDQTFRGRSNYLSIEGTPSNYSSKIIQQRFTAPEKYSLWPQASLHTQWPGSGEQGDPIFDAFYASNVIFNSNTTAQQLAVQNAGAALLDRIGKPAILIPHSQGGLVAWALGDARPNLTKAIYSIEPSGPPFFEAVFSSTPSRRYGLTDIPLTYSPAVVNATADLVRATIPPTKPEYISNCTIQANDPPPKQLANLATIPMVVLTTEASYHVPYDWCTVEYLKQAGVNASYLNLADVGIHGNGHMVFLEKNSDQVAGVVLGWLELIEQS